MFEAFIAAMLKYPVLMTFLVPQATLLYSMYTENVGWTFASVVIWVLQLIGFGGHTHCSECKNKN